ncbi:hypothetical protein PENANT_c001G09303 [Penicillium antarcticum]|uniref:Rhodopsin domain-containing protein n=1 Tax=Penicillium antarcticum TaxID=416450 RepID=A0A1V6QN62_9EURO|nr:hypothetical protein PENANT_c001G09303 [Penicillium antarcticum]
MSLSPFGEPPLGTDLSQEHRVRNNAAVISTLRLQQTRIAEDDWMIILSLLPLTANFICTIIGGQYGLGKHVWIVPINDVVKVMQLLFVYVLIYVAVVPLIKLSVLLFYQRIFGMTKMMWFCVFLTVGYVISCYIAFLVCCRPVSYYWSQYIDPTGGKCIFNLYPFYIGNAAANVTTDVIILLVPVPLVWKLQMRTSQKFMLCGIFMLGGFVCVASIIRIYYMTFLGSSVDITWIMDDVFIWSSVEPCIGILCASLPTLQPLLRLVIARVFGTSMGRYETSLQSKQEAERKHKKANWKPAVPPDWDEALLTTNAGPVEMGPLGRKGSYEGTITVDREFQMVEESHKQGIKLLTGTQ